MAARWRNQRRQTIEQSESRCANMRAMTPGPPLAANGTTMRIGSGYSANACDAAVVKMWANSEANRVGNNNLRAELVTTSIA